MDFFEGKPTFREVGTFIVIVSIYCTGKHLLDSPAVNLSDRHRICLSFSFQLTSQHPYMETFIGKPHVYTIDINDLELVDSTLKEILSSEVSLSTADRCFSQGKKLKYIMYTLLYRACMIYKRKLQNDSPPLLVPDLILKN